MHHTFRSVCILPFRIGTFFSLWMCAYIFSIWVCALCSVFESLSICLCPRNQNLILVWKKYHGMISISLAVTVDSWTLGHKKLMHFSKFQNFHLVNRPNEYAHIGHLWDLSPPFFVLVWKVKHIVQSSVKELVVSFSTTRCTRLYILKSGPPTQWNPPKDPPMQKMQIWQMFAKNS